MKRLLFALLTLALLLAIIAFGIIRYIKPTETLDLQYKELSIGAKVTEMIVKRQFAVELTEADVENIVKKQLAEQPQLSPDIRLTGARVELAGNRLNIAANVRYKNKIPAQVSAVYDLQWQEPNLHIVFRDGRIKSISLPRSQFDPQPIDVNLNELLPKAVAVKDVKFTGEGVHVELKLR
ncbi:MAG: hypothetical protein J7639_16725 [Paenibacillaceae bacterium]|nr:hypothetical protein [Paenibacillaceae bacterium]